MVGGKPEDWLDDFSALIKEPAGRPPIEPPEISGRPMNPEPPGDIMRFWLYLLVRTEGSEVLSA